MDKKELRKIVNQAIDEEKTFSRAQIERLNELMRCAIRAYRVLTGETIAEIAKNLNISAQCLYNWKSGTRNLGVFTTLLLKIYLCQNEEVRERVEQKMSAYKED